MFPTYLYMLCVPLRESYPVVVRARRSGLIVQLTDPCEVISVHSAMVKHANQERHTDAEVLDPVHILAGVPRGRGHGTNLVGRFSWISFRLMISPLAFLILRSLLINCQHCSSGNRCCWRLYTLGSTTASFVSLRVSTLYFRNKTTYKSGLCDDIVGSEDSHAVELGRRVGISRQMATDNLVLLEAPCESQHSFTDII